MTQDQSNDIIINYYLWLRVPRGEDKFEIHNLIKKRMAVNTTDLCLNLNRLSKNHHKPNKNLARFIRE
jgi:hypothetical protein